MDPSPATKASLLLRIRDHSDRDAWGRFVDIYGPMIYGFVRRKGLQDADAVDLMQEVLRSVAGAISRFHYRPAVGSFRGWLFTIVRNRLSNELKSRSRREQASGDTAVNAVLHAEPAESDWERQWDEAHSQYLLTWASQQVQDSVEPLTWRAFHRTAVDGASGKEVAHELGLTVAAVYLAKSRVMARLKAIIREAESEDDDAT